MRRRQALGIAGAESGDSAALAPVGSVRWHASGHIIIADLGASRLLVYDAAGAFVHALGRRGDRPGEFRYISAVTLIHADTVVTFDGSLRRLSYWRRRNGFARSVSLAAGASLDAWPAEAWPWRDSMIVVLQLAITPKDSVPAGAGMRRWPMRAHLSLRDREGEVVATSPTFPGMYTGLYAWGDTRLPFSNQPFVAVGRDRVFFGSGEAYRIWSLASEFRAEGEERCVGVVRTRAAQQCVLSGDTVRSSRQQSFQLPQLARPQSTEACDGCVSNRRIDLVEDRKPPLGDHADPAPPIEARLQRRNESVDVVVVESCVSVAGL